MSAPDRIADALPALQAAYAKLTDAAAGAGITFRIAAYGGVRTEADTAVILGYRRADYAAESLVKPTIAAIPITTWRPIAPWGHSYHDFGAAFDVELDSTGGLSHDKAMATLGGMAAYAGLRWGGTFTHPDAPHFELAISLADASAQWAARGPHPSGWTTYGVIAVLALLALLIVIH